MYTHSFGEMDDLVETVKNLKGKNMNVINSAKRNVKRQVKFM